VFELKTFLFQNCIETITKAALRMESPSNTILDAVNYEGKTVLHLLAASSRKVGSTFDGCIACITITM
jgi:hypothetical protein